MATNIIITGFKPFCDYPKNPSQSLVNNIVHPNIIKKFILNVSITDVDNQIPKICQLAKQSTSNRKKIVILHIGLDASTSEPIIEYGAKNKITFGCPDNEGKMVYDQPIDSAKSLESFLFSGLPIDKLFSKVKKRTYGGTYISNYVYYKSLWECRNHNIDCLYIHIPYDYNAMDSILKIIDSLISFKNYYSNKKYKFVKIG